jgi:mono/diheme cytochrome c family protein
MCLTRSRIGMLAISTAMLSWSVTTAVAQNESTVQRGRTTFEHSCAPCHGTGPGDDGRAMLPGTAALQIKYKGAIPPALEHRAGLTVDVLKAFVRAGSWSMPPFRKTEVTDSDLADIAAYLADSSGKVVAPATPNSSTATPSR